MLELFACQTPNTWKVAILLEELGVPYTVRALSLAKNEQKEAWFLAINPNGRLPALIDHAAGDFALFESGAILQYLGEKSGQFLPADLHGKYRVLQWVYWQVAGLGPNAGQAHHFLRYYPERLEYPMHRFRTEVKRLYTVMDTQLGRTEYLAGDYSIADMAAWPWVVRWDWQGQNLDDHPHLKRWFEAVGARPAVQRGAAVGADLVNFNQQMSDEDKKRLFNLRDQDLGGKPA